MNAKKAIPFPIWKSRPSVKSESKMDINKIFNIQNWHQSLNISSNRNSQKIERKKGSCDVRFAMVMDALDTPQKYQMS